MIRRTALAVLLMLCACSPDGATAAGAVSMPHPDNAAARVEYFLRKPVGEGPWPTVVLLHGAQPMLSFSRGGGGLAFVNYGVMDQLAREGYLAVAVSLPGYGNSSGPDDFAGPFTQHAVAGVIAKLVADGAARSDKVLLEGVSLGAITGALLAAHDPSIAGAVLISGLYDLPKFLDQPKSLQASLIKLRLRWQLGLDEEALRARSALASTSRIKAALILNGAQDDRTDPAQAQRLADQINASGGAAQIHIYREYGHEIPFEIRNPEVETFVAAILKSGA